MRIRNLTPWEAIKMDKELYDGVFISIRKFIEDHPNEEISIEKIHKQSGYEPKDIKLLLYYHLFVGDLRCETYKREDSMQTFMRFYNIKLDGSPVQCATKDIHGNHCPEYPTKQFNGVRLCEQCYKNARIKDGKKHNRKGKAGGSILPS